MVEPVLLVMAAGLGSRYGGMKQIAPVGKNQEIIIDYSLYDAYRAGFKKAVFIIKEENLADFKERMDKGAGKYLDIVYVFQDINNIPDIAAVPEGRTKPWGTGHAVLCAGQVIDAPFAVINADDFYGQEAFAKMYDFLTHIKPEEKASYAMVGFYIENTVTDHGSVSRGVCKTRDGYLEAIVERTRIEKMKDGSISYFEDDSWTTLMPGTIVSMNLWGFEPSIFKALQEDFERFLLNEVPKKPLKSEFFLPFVVDDMLKNSSANVKLLSSSDKWYGVTYKEDRETVTRAIADMTASGKYPESLWP